MFISAYPKDSSPFEQPKLLTPIPILIIHKAKTKRVKSKSVKPRHKDTTIPPNSQEFCQKIFTFINFFSLLLKYNYIFQYVCLQQKGITQTIWIMPIL